MDATFRHVSTADLTTAEVAEIRALLWAAFHSDDENERMTEEDWQHVLPGVHVVGELGGRIVAFASVVARDLHIAGRSVRAGYVEAVAVLPALQRSGLGSRLMAEVQARIRSDFELGALATGVQDFYVRLGWECWAGRTLVRTPSGDEPTPEEDGFVLVLQTSRTPPLDLSAPISCAWRAGDSW